MIINKIKNRYLSNWLGSYIQQTLSRVLKHRYPGPTHVLFQFVDHFELAGKQPRLAEWLLKYPILASQHRDADGAFPKHTWFYALDLMRKDELEKLKALVSAGFGEVELHWHHSHDTPESFQEQLRTGLKTFQQFGFMRPIKAGMDGCFGFIHGNWSLNNSRGDQFCGVNNEIELLKSAGCYGDFTFPALHCLAQPSMINSIHYASFQKGRAAYFKGRKAEVGIQEADKEFMIFQGPLTINWQDWRFKWHPTIENGEIGTSCTHADPVRVNSWIHQEICVEGRPDWVFVKVFCHGGQDHPHVLSETTDRMFSYLEKKYNDGVNYILHYVSSREAYNMVKAAEDGKSGNPNQYRDYIIPHPLDR